MASSAIAVGILTAGALFASPATAAAQGKGGRAQAPAPKLEAFTGSLEEARTSAQVRNVPLLVISILEELPFDEREHRDIVEFRESILEDRDLARASALAVVLVANNRIHELMEVVEERDGAKVSRKICSVYRSGECALHMRQFEQVFAAYNVDGSLRSPFLALHAPKGPVELRVDDGRAPKIDDVVSALQVAGRKAGEGLTLPALAKVRQLLEAARALHREKPGEALAAYEGVLALTKASIFAEEAREQQKALVAAIEAQRDEALEWMGTGKVAEGYERLEELAKQTEATALGRDLQRLLRKAETDKETREPVRAFKREREAEALFREVSELFERGNEREATRKARLLLQRFQGTKAAERAQRAWPDISGERGGSLSPHRAR